MFFFYIVNKVCFPVSHECHSFLFIFYGFIFALCLHTDWIPRQTLTLLTVFSFAHCLQKSSLDSRDTTHVRYLLNIHGRGFLFMCMCVSSVWTWETFFFYFFPRGTGGASVSQYFFITFILFSTAHLVLAEIMVVVAVDGHSGDDLSFFLPLTRCQSFLPVCASDVGLFISGWVN